MTISIFLDSDCTEPAGEILYEGRKYFVLLPDLDKETIAFEFRKANLTDFVAWSRHNKVATLQIINRIGLIRIFGRIFDVRSEKFFEGQTGPRQFQLLLDDLVKLSRQIIFDYSSATSAYRSQRKDAGASVLERFHLYRQRFYRNETKNSIEQCLEAVMNNPHSRLKREYEEDFIWNVRQPTSRTMRSLVSHKKQLVDLSNGHGHAADRSHRFFPLRAVTTHNVLDQNTPENRFVKYLLTDIEQVCLALMADQAASARILSDCEALLQATRRKLRHPFFRCISALSYFPASSPTLVSRHGYRELYAIFLRSRNGALHLFEDFANDSLFIDLKDVAQLYEYWVFYRIAISLLGEVAVVHEKNVCVKNNRLVNAIEISASDIRIAFNKTYTRRVNASYSLTLRPDICVTVGKGANQQLFVLDAKYKSVERTEKDEEDEPLPSIRVVKAADLHKMHCYVDAIQGVKAAIAVYPGSKTVFYPKDRHLPVLSQISNKSTLEGVGAAPLVPSGESEEFEALMGAIKKASQK